MAFPVASFQSSGSPLRHKLPTSYSQKMTRSVTDRPGWSNCRAIRHDIAITHTRARTHAHTHTHLTALCPGLPGWVSRYQKGRTNLDFTEARDSEWQWYQVCTLLQTDNHASTPPRCFYRLHALPAAQPTASKHWRYNDDNDRLTAFDPGQPG